MKFSQTRILPACNNMIPSIKGISNVDVETHNMYIQELYEDMENRFQDVFQLEIPNWIIDLFIGISEQRILAKKLITLQNDFEPNQISVSRINHFGYRANLK